MTPPELLPYNLGDILRLPAHGDHTALIELANADAPRPFSARQLDALCAAVGRGLLRLGVRPGSRIGIVAENCAAFIGSYLGIMRVGAIAVPVNHRLPQPTVDHIFRDSDIELAFCDASRRTLVPEGIPRIEFGVGADAFDAFLDPGPLETFVPDASTVAQILYTSGSTGMPKGVPLTHQGQLWAISRFIVPFAVSPPAGATIVVAPLYHMNGLFNTSRALLNRLTVISMPRFDARQFLETVAQYRCTRLSGIPTMYALIVRERALVERLDLTCVEYVSIGSAPLTDALFAEVKALFPKAQVENGFGTTEVGPAVFGPHPHGRPRPPLSVGYPRQDIDCKLIDGPSGDEGILALRTPALMRGYLNQPEATEARMRDGWYVTGDVMRRDAQGFYFFVGRTDDMFVCGGENIYPGEIEKLLERHPDVAQAIVVAAADDIKGQIPVAFIVPRVKPAPDPALIKQHAIDHGPAFAHPRFVEFRDSLPVSGTLKIDRALLSAEAAQIVRAAGRRR